MFNQHLHYDSNSKPAMQRRWSGDNLRRKLIAQKHLEHGAIHPFQLSKLSFWHILCLHCANKELSVQAVSNVLKLRLLLPGIWKKFLPTIPAHTCVQGNITSSCVFSYVSYAIVVSKKEVETFETYRYLIWDIHQSTNHMIRLPSLLQLSHRFAWNPVIQKHGETIYSFTVKITMLRLVLPNLTRRLFQSLANRKQKKLHGSEWPREISAKWLKWLELIFWSNYGHLEAPLNAGSRARVKISFHLCGPTLRVSPDQRVSASSLSKNTVESSAIAKEGWTKQPTHSAGILHICDIYVHCVYVWKSKAVFYSVHRKELNQTSQSRSWAPSPACQM